MEADKSWQCRKCACKADGQTKQTPLQIVEGADRMVNAAERNPEGDELTLLEFADMEFGELKKELHDHVEKRFDETYELVNEYARNHPVELNRETSMEVDNEGSEMQEVFDLYKSADCSSLARKDN